MQEEGLSGRKTALIMLALCMAVFLGALDVTIITTALPTIASHFKTSVREYSWIGSAYLLASAAVIPSSGKISDIFGRKPILLIANIVFLIGSLVCALAVSIEMLIVGRAFQGAGAGALATLVNICISDLFSERFVDVPIKALHILIHHQETRCILWTGWSNLGHCLCPRTRHRRGVGRKCLLEMVLLHQP